MSKYDLKTRLKIAKKKFNQKTLNNNKNSSSSSFGKALGLSTELVAAVLVGTIIGFILDSWFDSKPWLTLVFFFIGVVAGIMNVFKAAKKMQKDK
tara:strand:+ start:27 stop:311 length:285 start_codon:yes stop_codon:yes gene_type:complete